LGSAGTSEARQARGTPRREAGGAKGPAKLSEAKARPGRVGQARKTVFRARHFAHEKPTDCGIFITPTPKPAKPATKKRGAHAEGGCAVTELCCDDLLVSLTGAVDLTKPVQYRYSLACPILI